MLIGRTDDLDRLRSQLSAADDSAHRVVLVEGPMGIGKTALVNELIRVDLGSRVLFTRPDELATNIPLDGIRSIIEALLGDDLSALLERSTPRRLLHSLRPVLAEERTIIVIDDAHWLDPSAQDLVERLISDPTLMELSFVLCFRTGLVPDELLRTVARSGAVLHRTLLRPLSPADAAAVLDAHGASGAGLVELAGGNPLFLRILADATAADPSSGAVRPQEIGDALRAELSSLDRTAQMLLRALSLTPAVTPSTLAHLVDTDDDALLAAGEVLARRGLIDADRLEITHPFIRAAAYRGMTSGDRLRAHRVAARFSTDVLERAAHLQHLGPHLTAGELDDLMRAAEIVVSTSPRSCVALLRGSRRIPHRRRDVLLARALLLDGRPSEAESMLRETHATVPPTGEALSLLMQSVRIQSRPDEAFELARDAGAAALEPEALVELATLAVMHDDAAADPRTWLVDDDRAPGHATALACLRALSYLRVGDLERGRAVYRVAKSGFEQLSSSELLPVIDAVTALGWCAHFLADFTDGAALVERGIRLAENRGRFHVLPHLYLILAFLCIPLDRCDETDELVDLAISSAEKYNWPDAIPLALTASLVAAPGRVGPEELVGRFQRLVAAGLPKIGWWRRIVQLFLGRASIRIGVPFDRSVLDIGDDDAFAAQKNIGLGELALAAGDTGGALEHADAAIDWGLRMKHPSQAGHGVMLRSEILAVTGRNAEALADVERAAALFEAAGAPLYLRLARSRAERLRVAVPEESPALDALTRRERDVAELVADGLSNRDIAERLHLSPRTVESHVARILQKTGLRSRAGIARQLDATG